MSDVPPAAFREVAGRQRGRAHADKHGGDANGLASAADGGAAERTGAEQARRRDAAAGGSGPWGRDSPAKAGARRGLGAWHGHGQGPCYSVLAVEDGEADESSPLLAGASAAAVAAEAAVQAAGEVATKAA